jgi:Arc/MetJ-type ribon-helix-helix transcriptional regulator
MTQVTIALEDEQLKMIRALVASGESPSIAAFVQHAVAVALQDAAGWREMLEEALQQTGGPLTEAERAWADSIIAPAAAPRQRS